MNSYSIIGVAPVGDPGTGKDSTATQLLKTLPPLDNKPWKLCSVGTDLYRKKAAEHNMSIENFIKKRSEDLLFCPDFDYDVDRASIQYCESSITRREPFIITSRLVPALLFIGAMYPIEHPEHILKILFTCEHDERITRIVKRDFSKLRGRLPDRGEIKELFVGTENRTRKREMEDAARFKQLYRINNIFDPIFFDYIVDTTGMTLVDQTAETTRIIMKHL